MAKPLKDDDNDPLLFLLSYYYSKYKLYSSEDGNDIFHKNCCT